MKVKKLFSYFKKPFQKTIRFILLFLSVFSILFILLAFTSLPYWGYYHLAAIETQTEKPISYLVLMGGDGVPSPKGLMRTYYTYEASKEHPAAKIIIAMPSNPTKKDSLIQLKQLKKELILRGVDSTKILFEPLGSNTKEQVDNVCKILKNKTVGFKVVSSPEHLYRTIKTFKRNGYTNISSQPTFEVPSEELSLKSKKKGKNNKIEDLNLRYNFWSYMQYELIVLREYFAISYYKLKGWI